MAELTLDQALYSVSNFALAALAGRALVVDDFGRFALVALIGAVVVALVRAVGHEPNLAVERKQGVRHRSPSPRPGPATGRAGPARAVLTATAAAAVAVGLGTASLVTVGMAAVAATLAQDAARYRSIGAARPRPLLLGNLAWLAVVMAALLGPWSVADPVAVVRVWLVGAVAGLVPHLLAVPAPGAAERPGSTGPGRRFALLVDFVLFTGMTQVGGLVLGALLPLDQFAALRGAIMIYGPVGIAVAALSTWVFATVPVPGADVALVGRRAAVMGALGAALVAAATALPPSMGHAVLGSGWPPRAVLALVGLSVTAQAVSGPGFSVLRLADARRRLLALRVAGLVSFVSLTTALAVATGSAGPVAAGYAITNLSLAVAVWALPLAARGRDRAGPADEAGDAHRRQAGGGQQPGPVPVDG